MSQEGEGGGGGAPAAGTEGGGGGGGAPAAGGAGSGGGGGEGIGSKEGLMTLVSNTALTLTAVWGIKECREYPFITIGFGLFATRGILGVIQCLTASTVETEMKRLLKNVTYRFNYAAKVFFFPIVATEVMSSGCLSNCKLSVFNLMFPLLHYFITPMGDNLMTITRLASGIGVLWCQYVRKDSNSNNFFLIIPYVVSEMAWSDGYTEEVISLLQSYACLITALSLTNQYPKMLEWAHPNICP